MSLYHSSNEQDTTDLQLLIADLETIKIIESKGVGCNMTSFGVTLNQSKVLMLATRFGYCASCGRFSSAVHSALKSLFIETGNAICPRWFNASIEDAFRFAKNEPEFMLQKSVW